MPRRRTGRPRSSKDGNVVVPARLTAQDPRYKALLKPATVSGANAEIGPTIIANDTGHAAADDWWDVTATIPNSQAVDTVKVKCGEQDPRDA